MSKRPVREGRPTEQPNRAGRPGTKPTGPATERPRTRSLDRIQPKDEDG